MYFIVINFYISDQISEPTCSKGHSTDTLTIKSLHEKLTQRFLFMRLFFCFILFWQQITNTFCIYHTWLLLCYVFRGVNGCGVFVFTWAFSWYWTTFHNIWTQKALSEICFWCKSAVSRLKIVFLWLWQYKDPILNVFAFLHCYVPQ